MLPRVGRHLPSYISFGRATWNWKLEIEQIMWVQIPGFLTMRNRDDDRPIADVGGVINLGAGTRASSTTTTTRRWLRLILLPSVPVSAGALRFIDAATLQVGQMRREVRDFHYLAQAYAARSRWRFEFPRNTKAIIIDDESQQADKSLVRGR